MPVSPEMIASLMGGRYGNPNKHPKRFAMVVDAEGKLTKTVIFRMSGLGKFEGKAGSPKRSRKGRTYRAPNGRARYAHETVEVVAYKVTPLVY